MMLASVYRILLAVSFIGCIAVSVLWCRSYWVLDRYSYETDLDYNRKIRSDVGRLSYFRVTSDNAQDDESMLVSMTIAGEDVPASIPLVPTGGFHYEYGEYGEPGTEGAFTRLLLIIPYWAIVGTLAVMPVLATRTALRQRRAARSVVPTTDLAPPTSTPTVG